MSGYEAAAATRLLATHCICCRRPLLDAVSVEAGMGPVCRQRHGATAPEADPDWTAVWHLTRGMFTPAELFGDRAAEAATDATLQAAWRRGGIETRRVANMLTHRAAVLGREQRTEVTRLAQAAGALGYVKLSAALLRSLGYVTITQERDVYVLQAPYSPAGYAALKEIPRHSRRFNAAQRAWIVARSYKAALFAALRVGWAGLEASGPKGVFVIPPA